MDAVLITISSYLISNQLYDKLKFIILYLCNIIQVHNTLPGDCFNNKHSSVITHHHHGQILTRQRKRTITVKFCVFQKCPFVYIIIITL